jgi:4-diphosphocytidyl-2-C-methyl-D-erythritol kinase
MRTYSLLAAAKINLYLEIIGDRPDGYHELAMVMQSVDLADRVTLRKLSVDDIRVQCDHPLVPTDASNLVYRAAELLRQEFPEVVNRHGGIEITIEKHIPVGAGLAGGSANAAAALVGLDVLWDLGLTQGELQILGARLGSDVPFCIVGGTAIATGRGEKIASLTGVDSLYVVLAKHRSLAVSTPWAYKTFREQFRESYVSDPLALKERWHQVHAGNLVQALDRQDGSAIGQQLYNDFEKIVFPAYPQVQQLRDTLARLSSLGAMMSGSGPTVFALAASAAQFATSGVRLVA